MRIVLYVVLATIVAKSGGSSALRWLSWDEIREMMRDGVSEFKKQGEFVRPGQYPGAIYGGRFICRAREPPDLGLSFFAFIQGS